MNRVRHDRVADGTFKYWGLWYCTRHFLFFLLLLLNIFYQFKSWGDPHGQSAVPTRILLPGGRVQQEPERQGRQFPLPFPGKHAKKKKNICPIVCACVFVVRLLSDVPSANPVTLLQQLEPRKRPGVIEDLPRGGESSSYLCAIIKGDWTRPVHFSWAFFCSQTTDRSTLEWIRTWQMAAFRAWQWGDESNAA